MKVKQILSIGILLCCILLCSCVATKPTDRPLDFREGITYLAKDINTQLKKDIMGNLLHLGEKQKLVIDPFLDANSGQSLTINKEINNILVQELHGRFDVMRMEEVESVQDADLVLSGILAFEQMGTSTEKAYHFYISVYSRTTGIIKACANAYIKVPEYQPTAIYMDSPVFLRDNQLENLVNSMKRKTGDKISEKYLSYLNTKQYVVAADTAYEKGKYEQAIENYTLAEKQADGKNLNVYSGLYNSARLLHRNKEAENYFGKLINVSIHDKKKIEIKLLFKVNSAYFIDTGDLPMHYSMWLRQIAEQIRKNDVCVRIQGHSSKTGNASYNQSLSEKRAKMVQQVLAVSYPEIIQRSTTKGFGFAQNIVGSGTDDARDAIDRRVEFLLTDCR